VTEIWCKINDIRASNVTNKSNNLKVGRYVSRDGGPKEEDKLKLSQLLSFKL
jgi:hypothetical protein